MTQMLADKETSKIPDLLRQLLDEQQDLSAVEKFSRAHDLGPVPAQARYYRDLLPAAAPGPDQQYAFEVDLDSCTGCKACVAACHNLNGLDEGEAFRDVGLLHGGTIELPILQTVTTACHHCLEPACMEGCPVKAYEKDPVTGIVKHLDDQCIGCQYCILKCPYDVPKYNKSKGIVRKCDMCSDRLSAGEAPACVQACPNQAIRITVVDKQKVLEDAEASSFLPGAPDPSYTLPTTHYKTNRVLPRNMLPADYYKVEPQHAHFPLVLMLVLTQMSVGAFLVARILDAVVGSTLVDAVRPIHALGAVALGLLALAASTGHLGRPLFAFRAVIGLKTSWLSREILAFGLFAKLAVAYAAVLWFMPDMSWAWHALSGAVVATGLLGIFCSAMIYHDTQRAFWNISQTGTKFLLTAVVLGLSSAIAASVLAATLSESLTLADVMNGWVYELCRWLIGATVLKLAVEGSALTALGDRRHSPAKRTAKLMVGPLAGVSLRRAAFGVLGGLVVPVVLMAGESAVATGETAASTLFIGVMAGLSLILMVLGELHERYLFFTAVVSPKMPGGVM